MYRGELPRSEMCEGMVELPVPCGKHVVYYPASLALRAVNEHKYHVFMTSCECGTGYIVAAQDDGAHFRMGGPLSSIASKYELTPWLEHTYGDNNGVFYAKKAPSLDALVKYFEAMAVDH